MTSLILPLTDQAAQHAQIPVGIALLALVILAGVFVRLTNTPKKNK